MGKRMIKNIGFMNFLKEAFSENGVASSKRILAGIIILVVGFCTSYGCVKYGITDNLKSLLEVETISALSLLGVTVVSKDVSSIFRSQKETEEKDDQENDEYEK